MSSKIKTQLLGPYRAFDDNFDKVHLRVWVFQLWEGTCLLAVDAQVSTCGPKVSTCNPRAQTRCVSKHITHTDAHWTHSQIHTSVRAMHTMQTLCDTHTHSCTLQLLTDTHISVSKLSHTHTHTHAQLHILTETSKQTPSLLTHKQYTHTQTQKVRRTHCIATIRHNTAQLVGGEEWRGARDAAEENCQRSVEGTWD